MMTSLRKKIIAIGGALAYPTISLSPDITKEHFCRKWVLVTGASHGIGRALTEKLISAGANVFLMLAVKRTYASYVPKLSKWVAVQTTAQ